MKGRMRLANQFSTSDTAITTQTPTVCLDSLINLHVLRLWAEAELPGENPRMQGENMQTPQREICTAKF